MICRRTAEDVLATASTDAAHLGRAWAGLDFGERVVTVCVIDEHGVLLEAACAADATSLDHLLSPFRRRLTLVGMEAGMAQMCARDLRAMGYPLVLYETRRAKHFISIRRNKTDASDARGIADIARLGAGVVSQVHLKSPEIQHIQSQLSIRERLRGQRASLTNFISALRYCMEENAR